MNAIPDEITTIQKELIDMLHFPNKEVLSGAEKIKRRKDEAKRAMMLGNSSSNHKVKIVFEDTTGKKMVETTVWGVTDRYMLLKKGMTIPLNRIHEIII